jgi:hypothetical protein
MTPSIGVGGNVIGTFHTSQRMPLWRSHTAGTRRSRAEK